MLAALARLRDGNMGERSELIEEDVEKRQSVSEVTVSEVTVIKATSKMKNIKM
jgi:hypothetical protein